MKKRFVEGFYLVEQWCYLVPGSKDKAVPLQIGNLIEQTEEYESYEVTDCLMGFPCTIKVYLDPNVKPGGSRMLGLYGCAEIPEYDSARKNLYVFEIIDCKENYQFVKNINATSCCPNDTDAVQNLSHETDPKLTERTDEETEKVAEHRLCDFYFASRGGTFSTYVLQADRRFCLHVRLEISSFYQM